MSIEVHRHGFPPFYWRENLMRFASMIGRRDSRSAAAAYGYMHRSWRSYGARIHLDKADLS